MTRHQKNEAHGVRGREDAIGSATARGGENRAGTRAVRTNRSSFELPRRSRPGTRDREPRSPPPGVPESPPEHARVSAPPQRACLKWRAARPTLPSRLSGRDAARLRETRRLPGAQYLKYKAAMAILVSGETSQRFLRARSGRGVSGASRPLTALAIFAILLLRFAAARALVGAQASGG